MQSSSTCFQSSSSFLAGLFYLLLGQFICCFTTFAVRFLKESFGLTKMNSKFYDKISQVLTLHYFCKDINALASCLILMLQWVTTTIFLLRLPLWYQLFQLVSLKCWHKVMLCIQFNLKTNIPSQFCTGNNSFPVIHFYMMAEINNVALFMKLY